MVVTTYDSGHAIPKGIQRSLRLLGLQSAGHMRMVAMEAFSQWPDHPENQTELLHAFVATNDDGKAEGWACVYRISSDMCCSIWVNRTCRRKGVGRAIMREVFKMYRDDPPELFGYNRTIWNELQQEYLEGISPNASVTYRGYRPLDFD